MLAAIMSVLFLHLRWIIHVHSHMLGRSSPFSHICSYPLFWVLLHPAIYGTKHTPNPPTHAHIYTHNHNTQGTAQAFSGTVSGQRMLWIFLQIPQAFSVLIRWKAVSHPVNNTSSPLLFHSSFLCISFRACSYPVVISAESHTFSFESIFFFARISKDQLNALGPFLEQQWNKQHVLYEEVFLYRDEKHSLPI